VDIDRQSLAVPFRDAGAAAVGVEPRDQVARDREDRFAPPETGEAFAEHVDQVGPERDRLLSAGLGDRRRDPDVRWDGIGRTSATVNRLNSPTRRPVPTRKTQRSPLSRPERRSAGRLIELTPSLWSASWCVPRGIYEAGQLVG
jgi:hypothetical protein